MIPFLDLAAQYAEVGPAIEEAALRVLRSGGYVLGPEVAAFEKEFARAIGTTACIGTSTGTSALWLALKAAGIGSGDEVVTTPSTFVATVAAILQTGATPVLADIDPETWNLDPQKAEDAIGPRTRAILPVHLHGRPADLSAFEDICRRRNLLLVEDAAQAHLAESRGRRCGTVGRAGCFSFYPGKNLGSAGEGGAVTTSDPDLARRVRMLRDWGAERKYHHELAGSNERLHSIQAAILRCKLPRLAAWNRKRADLAVRYNRILSNLPLGLPAPAGDDVHAWHVYAIRTERRDALQAALAAKDIQSGIHYPVPVHLQPAYPGLGGAGSFPESEKLARETLSLPLFPEMTESQQDQVAEAIEEAIHG